MTTPFTLKRLTDIKDSAPGFGFAETQEARFASGDLGAEHTGVSHHRVKPGRRQAFAHRHERAEEVYVVLAGSGRVKLDEQIVEVGPRDAIRVAAPVTRAFEAGPQGLEILAFGPRHEGDGELLADWWTD
jgi:uncharacterized cupin superfamily protein